ncbi:MAG: penicillin acylase family protein [Anaerolineae bacterium]|nr:penicillin acylase family protein [Anaerolineae bacterium]
MGPPNRTGQAAALAGPDYAEQDRFFRTLNLTELAMRDLALNSPEGQALLEAFAAGVNAWLADKPPQAVAPEYAYFPEIEAIEPWQPLDSQLWQLVMSSSLALGGLEVETALYLIQENAGPFAGALLLPEYPYGIHPVIAEPGATLSPTAHQPLPAAPLNGLETLANLRSLGVQALGSNNWVVSGTRSASGAAMLANDPHLGIQLPAIWYMLGLHCAPLSEACPYDVVGYSLPQAPLVVIGHNQQIAWGMTNVGTDVADLYLMELDEAARYRFEDTWLPLEPARRKSWCAAARA